MASLVLFIFSFCVGSFSFAIARPSRKGTGYFITRPEINLCTLRVNKEDITFYKEFVVGTGWIVRPCAPGASYDPKTCACSNFSPKEQKDAISGKFSNNGRKESHTVREIGARSEDDIETGISYGTVYGSYKHRSGDDYRPASKDELDTSNSMESNKTAYNTRGYSKDGPDARDYSKNSSDAREYSKDGPDAREYSEDAYDPREYGEDAYDPREYGKDAYDPREYGEDAYDPREYGEDAYDPRDYSNNGPDAGGYSEYAYDMRDNSLNESTNHNSDKHERREDKNENNLMDKLLKLVFQNTSKQELEEVSAFIEELLWKHL